MVYADSDKALILSCLPRFSIEDKREILRLSLNHLDDGEFPQDSGIYKDAVIEKLYHEICREVPAFRRSIVPFDVLRPLFVQPDKGNGRILKQDGAFILTRLSNDGLEEQTKLEIMNCVYLKVKEKNKILWELGKLGMNEATLFPEMEHMADYLKSGI